MPSHTRRPSPAGLHPPAFTRRPSPAGLHPPAFTPRRKTSAPPLAALLLCLGLSALTPGPAGANGITPPNPDPDVHILLSGPTTVNNAQEALTGQTITATLSVGGTINSITWSVSGSVFKTWSETTIPQKVALGSTDYSPTPPSTALTFNDATDNDQVTVSCTGTYTDLDGDTMPFNPTPQAVTFMKPTVTAWGINTGTDVQAGIEGGITAAVGNGTGATIYGQTVWGPITIGNTTLGGTNIGGVGCVAQIVQSNNSGDTRSPGAEYVGIMPDGNGGYMKIPSNSLDGAFPYPIGYTLSGGVMNTGSPTGTSQFTLPSGYSGDRPSISMFPNSTDNWTTSNFNDSFGTWVMYKPPGGIWVPLQMLTWSCANSGAPGANGNVMDPFGNLWIVLRQSFSGGSPATTTTYPSWTTKATGITLGVPTS